MASERERAMTMTKIVHNLHDGFCVTCEETAEWLREHNSGDVIADHGTGGVVVWTIRIPGYGAYDETIAPTYREALEWAKRHAGPHANVVFSHVRHAVAPVVPSSAYVHTGFEVGAL